MTDYERRVRDVACWIYFTGTAETTNGSWVVHAPQIETEFRFKVDKGFLEDVRDYLWENHDGVADADFGDDYIDIVFYLHYCGLEEEDW